MKLACNWSPQLEALLARGLAPLDFIKAGAYGPYLPELDRMRSQRPVLLHGMGSHERTGMPDCESLDFARMNSLLDAYGSPHMAIHMGVTQADAAGLDDEGIHRRMVGCARHFMRNLAVELLLENTGDTPEERKVYRLVPFVEPARIRRLLEETGARLLLDIAHAKVTAQFRGWDLRAYLTELPLHAVGEVHVTGTGFDAAGAPYDAHAPMEDEDFADLAWVLARTRPSVVTLEYGGLPGLSMPEADEETLLSQLLCLREILDKRTN